MRGINAPSEATKTTKAKFFYSQPDNAVLYDKTLCKTAYQLYNILVEMSNKKTNQVFTKVSTLAERLGRSTRTVRIHLATLVKAGIIDRKKRKSPSNPKKNISSLFTIIGRFAPRYQGSEFAPQAEEKDQKLQQSTEESSILIELEPIEQEKDKDITLSRGDKLPKVDHSSPTCSFSSLSGEGTCEVQQEAGSRDEGDEKISIKAEGLEEVPDIMRPTVRYLLMQSGRKALSDYELELVSELSKAHTPTRIQKEIDVAVERFGRMHRSLKCLSFSYIAACLESQKSLKPKKAKTPAKKSTHSNKETATPAPQVEQVQGAVIEETSEPESVQLAMPVEEAEKVIAEYEPATKDPDPLPTALKELLEAIPDRAVELSKQMYELLPKDEKGETICSEEQIGDLYKLDIEDYLSLKYPEADEEELRTDHLSQSDQRDLELAMAIDTACAYCEDPEHCSLPEGASTTQPRPTAMLKEGWGGRRQIMVGWGGCVRCKHSKTPKENSEVERMMKRCGLTQHQTRQTLAAFECGTDTPELIVAKAMAVKAAREGKNLILSGRAGTGKTHLATAIAIEAMRHGKQAAVMTVTELQDLLANQAMNNSCYFADYIMKYKRVPCLVLDDWGKERTTEARLSYLFEIIDYRYKHGLQTIATTNALDMEGLKNKYNADAIEPMVSRLLENGVWVTIREAANHRLAIPSHAHMEKNPQDVDKPKANTPKVEEAVRVKSSGKLVEQYLDQLCEYAAQMDEVTEDGMPEGCSFKSVADMMRLSENA